MPCFSVSSNLNFVLGLLHVYCQGLYSGSLGMELIPCLVEFQWSVLQYIIIRPAGSIAGIICEALDVLCESAGYSWRYASVWIEGINFVSIRYSLVFGNLFLSHAIPPFKYCSLRPSRVLWPHARRTQRTTSDGQIFVY